MEDFQSLGLPQALNSALQQMQFTKPTPIQAQAIPHALEGKDILGSAQTGTGKTAAFSIPLVVRLLSHPYETALVMTPTRELAAQVMKQIQMLLGDKSSIKAALLIGGDSMSRQISRLRCKPRVVVGTPGRIYDHLQRKTLSLSETGFLVLDETDRMLDMGFTIQIEKILKFMPKKRQTLLFSATIPKNIARISQKYLHEPVHVSVSTEDQAPIKIKQEVIRVKEADKYEQFLAQLDSREGSIIVFAKTKHGVQKIATRLCKEGYEADAIHGDLRQSKRDRVIASFRRKKYRILVATDVASRGLDIPHIEHVINYDLPQCPEDYIHRIGRTARAGAEGSALCFVLPWEGRKWQEIERLLDPTSYAANADSSRDDRSGDRRRGGGRKKTYRRKRSFDGDNASSNGSGSFSSQKRDYSKRSFSRGPGGSGRSDGPRSDGPSRAGGFGRSDGPRSDRPSRAGGFGRSDGPRSDRPSRAGGFGRSDGPRSDRPSRAGGFGSRSDGPRSDGPSRSGGPSRARAGGPGRTGGPSRARAGGPGRTGGSSRASSPSRARY